MGCKPHIVSHNNTQEILIGLGMFMGFFTPAQIPHRRASWYRWLWTGIWRAPVPGEGAIWLLDLVGEGSPGPEGEERWAALAVAAVRRQTGEEFQAQGQQGGSPVSHKVAER